METENDNRTHLVRAAECWRSGKPLEAGRLIFERLASEARPKWAARVLKLAVDKSGIKHPLFEQVLRTADERSMWAKGHRLFSEVRDSTLELDNVKRTQGLSEEQRILHTLFVLAELVAKVTYNATDPPDEFDEDSGWWIAVCLRRFVDSMGRDDEFAVAAWSALSGERE